MKHRISFGQFFVTQGDVFLGACTVFPVDTTVRNPAVDQFQVMESSVCCIICSNQNKYVNKGKKAMTLDTSIIAKLLNVNGMCIEKIDLKNREKNVQISIRCFCFIKRLDYAMTQKKSPKLQRILQTGENRGQPQKTKEPKTIDISALLDNRS